MMQGYFFEDLQIGQTASVGKTITEADILLYAAHRHQSDPHRHRSGEAVDHANEACRTTRQTIV